MIFKNRKEMSENKIIEEGVPDLYIRSIEFFLGRYVSKNKRLYNGGDVYPVDAVILTNEPRLHGFEGIKGVTSYGHQLKEEYNMRAKIIDNNLFTFPFVTFHELEEVKTLIVIDKDDYYLFISKEMFHSHKQSDVRGAIYSNKERFKYFYQAYTVYLADIREPVILFVVDEPLPVEELYGIRRKPEEEQKELLEKYDYRL